MLDEIPAESADWFTIRIKRRIPSQNKYWGAHWRQKSRDRNAWLAHILSECGGKYEPPAGKRRLVIIHHAAHLMHDKANLIGGSKGLVDAITKAGLLKDDSDKLADIYYDQNKCKRVDEHTEIRIEGFRPLRSLVARGTK